MEMMSVDLSITMTAAVPSPDCASLSESKSILSQPVRDIANGTKLPHIGFWGGPGRRNLLGLSLVGYPIRLGRRHNVGQ
jgi:hypothetical protein